MKKSRILASVSTVALVTAASMGAARADNALFDLDIAVPDVEVATSSAAIIALGEYGLVSNANASTTGVVFGDPIKDAHDYSGGTVSLLVDKNEAGSLAFFNDTDNTIDLFVADGTANLDAATIAILQVAAGGGVTSIDATTVATARISAVDLGEGSAASVTDNLITATLAGNTSVSMISGKINPGLTGGELGQSSAAVTGAPYELESGAVALVATAQIFDDFTSPDAFAPKAVVSLRALTDDATAAVVGSVLDVSGNEVRADAGANDATGIVSIGTGGDIAFEGSAGVSNLQYASEDPSNGLEVLHAAATSGSISAGTADLDGSTLTMRANAFIAEARLNDAFNQVTLAKGLDLDGTATAAQQVNGTTGSVASDVAADLFIHNTQTGLMGTLGNTNNSVMSTFTRDLAGSTVTAGDGDLKDAEDGGNRFFALSTGNEATNSIAVAGGASVAGLAGINSTQVMTSSVDAVGFSNTITASIATFSSEGVVDASSISADGNSFEGRAFGNNQASTLSVAAGTIDGAGVLGTPSVIVNRSVPGDAVEADFSVLNAQVLSTDTGLIGTGLNDLVRVEVANQDGVAGSKVSDTQISVTANDIAAASAGNLSTATGIALDAGTDFTGTLGVINDQTMMEGSTATSSAGNFQAILWVLVTPESITGSDITVTDNSVSSRSWGNLATANSFSVDGVTVTDGDGASALLPSASIDRSTDVVPISKASGSFALLNDQSVEDMEGRWVGATVFAGHLVDVLVGSDGTTEFSNDFVVVDGNTIDSAATLNQAVSTGAVTATSLDASSSLVNVQTVADEDGDTFGGQVVTGIEGAAIEIEALTKGGDITESDFAITGNSASATSRINLASNALSVTAQTQTLTGTVAAAAQQSVVLGTDTETRGETTLVNDQHFDNIRQFDTKIAGMGLIATIAAVKGDMVDIDAALDGNTLEALSSGNEAFNTITLDIGTYDLDKASSAGGVLNGPVATLASNQRALEPVLDVLNIVTDVSGNPATLTVVGNNLARANLSADGNVFSAEGRVNTVTNTLTAKGASFETPTTASPLATVLDTVGGDDVVLDQTGFVVASRQDNNEIVATTVAGSVTLTADVGTIDKSSLTVDNNLFEAISRGNESANTLALDFTVNEAQGFVVNVQPSNAGDPYVAADVLDSVSMSVVATGSTATASDFSVSGNDVQALASFNRTTNTLISKGAVVAGGSGAAPSVAVDANLTGDIKVAADLAIVNAQGSETVTGPNFDTVVATLNSITGSVTVGEVITGSLAVDNNMTLSEAITHGAANSLWIDAGAAVGGVGASVTSQQIIPARSVVMASARGIAFSANAADLDDPGAVAVTVDNNLVDMAGIGGIAENTLRVDAGASITGTVTTPSPTLGTATGKATATLDADFNILNLQVVQAQVSVITGGSAAFAADAGTALAGDSVSVSGNTLRAQGTAFDARNVMVLDAWASSDATGTVANRQIIGNSGVTANVLAEFTVGALGADGSVITVVDNDALAGAVVNTAVNLLVVEAGAALQESSGAGLVLDPSAADAVQATGADYSVLNWQTNAGAGEFATVSGVTAGVDLLPGPVDDSSVSVSGNTVIARAVSNNAVNQLVLNTGTFEHPSATVANVQTNEGAAVISTVSSVTIGIGLTGGMTDGADNSSFSVTDNKVSAIAIGNYSANIISSGE